MAARPGGRRAAGPARRGERVGPGAQQLPGCGVVEHQGGGLDPDADPAARRGSPRRAAGAGEADQAAAGDRPFHLDGLRRLRPGAAATGPAGRAPLATSLARSVTRQVRADGLDPGAADRTGGSGRQSAQNRTTVPARTGPSQNCRPATCMFPDGRDDPVELDRPAVPLRRALAAGPRAAARAGSPRLQRARPGRVRRPGSPGATGDQIPRPAGPGRTGRPE